MYVKKKFKPEIINLYEINGLIEIKEVEYRLLENDNKEL